MDDTRPVWTSRGWLASPPSVDTLRTLWSSLSRKDKEGMLYFCARGGHDKLLRFVLDQDVNVNAHCPHAAGSTALHGACWGAHAACVTMLVRAGADEEAMNMYREKPSDNADARGMLDVLQSALDARTRVRLGEDFTPSLMLLLCAHKHGCSPHSGSIDAPSRRTTWSHIPKELVQHILVMAFRRSVPPLIHCHRCGWRVCGMRCCGHRDASMRVKWKGDGYYGYRREKGFEYPKTPPPICGELLVAGPSKKGCVVNEVHLRCPKGCGSIVWRCCRKGDTEEPSMVCTPLKSEQTRIILKTQAQQKERGHGADLSPMATCTQCGYSTDGALCGGMVAIPGDEPGDGCTAEDVPLETHLKLLPRNGFFERVWCAFVWSCESGCGRTKGGLFHASSDGYPIGCKSMPSCTGAMEMLDYNERHGFPVN